MYYQLYITHPDFPDIRQIWLPLSDTQIAELQEFIKQEFNKFQTACPEDAKDESLWHDWLEDAFAEATDLTVNIGRINPAFLMDIDMNSRCANPPANEIVFNS